MNKYNGYDELSDRKQMQRWAGSKKFHDDNDKSIAELEKEKEEKEKRKAKDFKNTAPCYMKPSNTKTAKKKVNENSVVKLGESQLRKIVAESVKKVLKEEHEWDGMLSGGKVLDRNIKDGNAIGDIRLMCEFLQKYVMPNGEEQDGKFIYRGHAVDATEINRSIHEAVRYLYNIVKQFGY